MPDRKLYSVQAGIDLFVYEDRRRAERQAQALHGIGEDQPITYIESTPAREHAEELHKALTCALEYIDAIPLGTALPTMPGFDRDWANDLLAKTSPEVPRG